MNASPVPATGQLDTSPIDTDDLHAAIHAGFLSSHPDPHGQLSSDEPNRIWCTAALPDDVWWHSAAIHESAHATLAWMLGLSVQHLALARDRGQRQGGGAWVDGPADAQYYTVEMLGPAAAQADWLTGQGYSHPELRRCVEQLSGSGDQAIVDGFVDQGFVVDRAQAVQDARALLDHPRAQAALHALAGRLLEDRDLKGSQITHVFRNHRLEQRPHTRVWRPGLRLGLIAAPPMQRSPHRAELPEPTLQAPQEEPTVSLEQLLALAKRIDAESQSRQRVAKTPQERARTHRVTAVVQPHAEHSDHLLDHGHYHGRQP